MIFYVATSFPFLVVTIYIQLTMFSATLVFTFHYVIVPIWFAFYEFRKTCNVDMFICFPFSLIVPIITAYFSIMTCFLQQFNAYPAVLNFKRTQFNCSLPFQFRWTYRSSRVQTCFHFCLISPTWASLRSCCLLLFHRHGD